MDGWTHSTLLSPALSSHPHLQYHILTFLRLPQKLIHHVRRPPSSSGLKTFLPLNWLADSVPSFLLLRTVGVKKKVTLSE